MTKTLTMFFCFSFIFGYQAQAADYSSYDSHDNSSSSLIEPDESSKDSMIRKEKSQHIMCPVIRAMYLAGHIIPNVQNNEVELEELISALHDKIGVQQWFAEIQGRGVAAYKKGSSRRERKWCNSCSDHEKRYLNIFTMEDNPHVRHAFGTAVLSKNYSPQERFDKFMKPFFIDGVIYQKDLQKIIDYAREHGEKKGERSNSTNVTANNWQMTLAINGWMSGFGKTDKDGQLYMTLEDAQSLYVDGEYPRGWVKRSWGKFLDVVTTIYYSGSSELKSRELKKHEHND